VAIGIHLLAKLGSPAKETGPVVKEIADWFRQKCAELDPKIHQGKVGELPSVFLKLHPGAEEAALTLIDPEHVGISATTSSVGPGYHIFLVNLLQEWAREFKASWLHAKNNSPEFGDETGYFISGDDRDVFRHMTDWLQKLAKSFFDGTLDPGSTGINLSMPASTHFEGTQPALTALGPRDREWLRQVSRDGGHGKDFFAWWNPAIDADYFLGRALTLMWTMVRWRPAVSEGETDVLTSVARSLATGFGLDPSLQYPWNEWAQILNWLADSPPERNMVVERATGSPIIGYRRGHVTETLTGGWRMRIPGSFSEFEFDESHNLFAVDPPREIWFTSFRLPGQLTDEQFSALKEDFKKVNASHVFEDKESVSTASIIKNPRDSGGDNYMMHTMNATRTAKAVCTFVFANAEDESWAVETWKSLRPPPPTLERTDLAT
jgi:hypothetical protein